MNERMLARVLFVFGFGTFSLASFFGAGWHEAGILWRIAFAVGIVAATVAVGLDFKHRHQDKKSQSTAGGGPV